MIGSTTCLLRDEPYITVWVSSDSQGSLASVFNHLKLKRIEFPEGKPHLFHIKSLEGPEYHINSSGSWCKRWMGEKADGYEVTVSLTTPQREHTGRCLGKGLTLYTQI